MESETTRLNGVVEKGWGYELIWATNDKYCGKLMVFQKAGARFSMHFHREKDETWFVNNGRFLVKWIDTKTAKWDERDKSYSNYQRYKAINDYHSSINDIYEF